MWQLAGADRQLGAYLELLLFTLFAVFITADALRLHARRKELNEILRHIDGYADALPAGECTEADFRAIAEALRESAAGREAANDAEKRAALEYFTLWVHQIKTPIFALKLLSEAGRLTGREADRELFRIERYVESALNYIKCADLAADTVISVCRADDVARESLKKYAPVFIAKGLRASLEPTGIITASDPKWLAFIIEQILSNSLKYTESGGVAVSGGGRRLMIEDTGIGFPAEDAARVLEKGYTGANGRVDKRATGMGLYLASRVAEALHIGIAIDSVPGRGTRVTLTLPEPGEMFE